MVYDGHEISVSCTPSHYSPCYGAAGSDMWFAVQHHSWVYVQNDDSSHSYGSSSHSPISFRTLNMCVFCFVLSPFWLPFTAAASVVAPSWPNG